MTIDNDAKIADVSKYYAIKNYHQSAMQWSEDGQTMLTINHVANRPEWMISANSAGTVTAPYRHQVIPVIAGSIQSIPLTNM
jgi:hypothetical protein